MVRIFVDQDFDHNILRGLRLRLPTLDSITALQAGLNRASDPEILEWASKENRVILTHDRNTMPAYAYRRIRSGEQTAGIFIVPRDMPIGTAISELDLLIACSEEGEWSQLVLFLPL